MPVLHSTKNLKILKPPTATQEGVGIFEFTDHYTVFHYGRMPDQIPGKGESICHMAVFNFALLEAAGVATHFRRFIPPNRIEFTLARVPGPDSAPPTPAAGNYLIPVQVLFRNELPQGSSVHRRLAAGELTPAQIGLRHRPALGEKLKQPLIEYATMLEEVNRYLSGLQAQRLTGLHETQFQAMRDTTIKVNHVLTGHARKIGLNHCDGKVEYLMSSDTRIVVADTPGTPDESRLMLHGVHCGKQVLRNWYVNHGLQIPVNQLIANRVPRSQWPQPKRLPTEFLAVMSDMYRALAQAWTGNRLGNAPDLNTATRAVSTLIR